LFVMQIGSREVHPMLVSTGNDMAPSVSPNGRLVAFHSDRDGASDLYVLDRTSGAVTRLTIGLNVRAQPGWSKDGERLLFSGSATGVDEIYIVQRDGTGLKRLSHGTEGIR
jgi:TolB protein